VLREPIRDFLVFSWSIWGFDVERAFGFGTFCDSASRVRVVLQPFPTLVIMRTQSLRGRRSRGERWQHDEPRRQCSRKHVRPFARAI
jgi:hypothetical protein